MTKRGNAKTKTNPMTDSSNDESKELQEAVDATFDVIEPVDESDATVTPVELNSNPTTAVEVSKSKPGNLIIAEDSKLRELLTLKNFDDLPYVHKVDILASLAKDPKTGLKSAQNAVLILEKSKELRIGWANAISHLHFIKDKLGIDIHIIKAILSRPGTGIIVKKIEDHKPIFRYTDGSSFYEGDRMLPDNALVVNKLPKSDAADYDASICYVVRVPTNVAPANKQPVWQYFPIDWRTTYEFTRKKKDIDGSWITVTEIGSFSWLEAVQAKLPVDAAGEYNPNSNWQKYRKLMIATRAYTFGAREIASDLLMGAYETTELFDMNNIKYDAKDYIKE